MPYKSDAQRRFFHSPGAKRAGLTKKQIKEWDVDSKGQKNMPERIGKKSSVFTSKTAQGVRSRPHKKK